jgi:2-oxoglutarate dehydrogenase E2 component (dihydrolipoamide succinyltransferase)
MSTPIVMPQMGESIAEGTIVRWIKKVGDPVERDEPLFEISTDKVDAEIPAPAAGVLVEITAQAGETVPVNTVVGTIGVEGAVPSGTDATDVETPAATARPQAHVEAGVASASTSTQSQPDGSSHPDAEDPETAPQTRRHRSSPLVRRIAREHQVDVAQVRGTGAGGRVTKHDILNFVEGGGEPVRGETSGSAPRGAAPGGRIGRADDTRIEVRPLSVMRRKIAEHMILSRRTSAHVHSVFHVNFSRLDRIRQQRKTDYESRGARLTFMSFIAKAVVEALRRHPIVNTSLDGDNIIYKKDINLGVAVSVEGGLIVPVIRNADEKSMLGLSRAIADVAERARTKQLKPEEVQQGTFTITNPGQFGAQFGMPIINQPQVAILGVGTIEKRPVVIDDALAIRPMAYLTLGYDHRLIDGAIADQFMADIKTRLETFDEGEV